MVSQPFDRGSRLPALGEIDEEAGEFWVENPFLMHKRGDNLSAYERNRLFLNTRFGDERGPRFLDASFASNADLDSDSRSAIAADFDRDGDLDLLVGSVGGGPLRLFLNQLPQGNRVAIRLVGHESNASGIGCRVTIRCGQTKLVRDTFPASGFMGTGPASLLVGLGTADQIDALSVRWPNGRVQTFGQIPVNQSLTITEDQDELESGPLAAPSVAGSSGGLRSP